MQHPHISVSEKCQASKKRNKVVADRASSCVCIVASCQNAARPWEKSVEGSNLMLLAVTSGLAEDASRFGSRHGQDKTGLMGVTRQRSMFSIFRVALIHFLYDAVQSCEMESIAGHHPIHQNGYQRRINMLVNTKDHLTYQMPPFKRQTTPSCTMTCYTFPLSPSHSGKQKRPEPITSTLSPQDNAKRLLV